MKRKLKLLILCLATICLCFGIVGCSDFSNPTEIEDGSMQHQIYLLAKDSGYDGTYQEWLDSIRGADGSNGHQIELRVSNDGELQWRYQNEDDSVWKKLISIDDLVGSNGSDGQNGKDGLTPYIGENGNWWIGDTDTTIKAQGNDGSNGSNGSDGQNGKDGLTPYIGENGNWWIGDTDTTIKVQGNDGSNGSNGSDGEDGKPGLSAYEIYLKHNPDYWGTSEEEWLEDLVWGRLVKYSVTFRVDGQEYQVIKVYTNKGIDNLPEIPFVEGFFAVWGRDDLDNITANTIVNAMYFPDDEYIEVSTEEQLFNIRYYLEGNYILTDNIVLKEEWIPIGKYQKPFTGTLDGKGYSIKGLHITDNYDYVGLFGYTRGATIKNLEISSVKIMLYGEINLLNVGAIVGKADESITIEGCGAKGNILVQTSSLSNVNAYIGGLVGTSENACIINSTNKVAINIHITDENYTSYIDVGGITGGNQGYFTNENCVSDSRISIDSYGSISVGGIAGYSHGSSENTYCINNSPITANSRNGNVRAGGILGAGAVNSSTVYYSSNNGDITVEAVSYADVGGIVGGGTPVTIISSTNTGYIYGFSSGSYAYSGGLIGYSSFGSLTSNISNSHNIGTVWANSVSGICEGGGLIGKGNVGIQDSHNTGNVSSVGISGGLIGSCNMSTITNSFNTGNIIGVDSVGGIMGHGMATINCSYNLGEIRTNSNSSPTCAGGMFGSGSGTIANSYNMGPILAHSNNSSASAGGMFGYGSATIIDSFNAGNVSSNSNHLSAFAGGLTGNGVTLTITNSYNLGNVLSSNVVGGLAGCAKNGIYENCLSLGEVTGNISGIIVGDHTDSDFINCHYYGITADETNDAILTTISQLNSKSFYTNTLGWSEEVWYLDNLDFENRILPSLIWYSLQIG